MPLPIHTRKRILAYGIQFMLFFITEAYKCCQQAPIDSISRAVCLRGHTSLMLKILIGNFPSSMINYIS